MDRVCPKSVPSDPELGRTLQCGENIVGSDIVRGLVATEDRPERIVLCVRCVEGTAHHKIERKLSRCDER